MPTLLTSDELPIQVLFTESATEVMQLLRVVVRQREPVCLAIKNDTAAHFLNLASIGHFQLVQYADDDPVIAGLDDAEKETIAMSIAGMRS